MNCARSASIAGSLPFSPSFRRARCDLNTSQASSSSRTVDSSALPLPLRNASNSVSISCVASVSCAKPKVPLPPLIEWAARKMASSVSLSLLPEPSPMARSSMVSRCSWASSKKVAMKRLRSIAMDSGLAQHFLDDFEQRRGVERLHQPAGGAGRTPLLLHRVRRLGREQQDRRALVVAQLPQAPHQREPVHVRHVLVGDDEVDVGGGGAIEALRSVLGLDDAIAGGLEHEGDHLAHGGGVVDGKDGFHGL